MANGSPLTAFSCTGCAEACKACAAECDKFAESEMNGCAKMCHSCEKSRLAMVRAVDGH
jgi:hypothetical protein